MFEELDLKIGEGSGKARPDSSVPTSPAVCPSRPVCTHSCTCGSHCTETCL